MIAVSISYEKIIIDEELYERNKRIHMGMDSSDLTLPLKLIQETGGGGEFLTHAHTLSSFRTMWHPDVSNWDSTSEFEKSGFQDSFIMANRIWKERLQNAPETFLDAELERELKAFVDSH